MAGVTLGLIAFFLFLISRFNGSELTTLYGNLEPDDSRRIVSQLEARGIEFELRNNGREVLVPATRVPELRMNMAQEGLPSDNSLGFEIFDRNEGLGTTSFMQNVSLLRALEGELVRSIRSLRQVEDARVHLVLRKRELFSQRTQEPSASVILKTRKATRLPKAQIAAIQHLVAAAIPGLKPGRISIIDDRGRLLVRAGDEGSEDEILMADAEEIRRNHENRMAETIEQLLSRSVGPGRVRAQVAVEMDFDRISTNSETYDPDGQVVRSTQTVEENSRSNESEGQNSVTVENNLPDSQANGPGGNRTSSQSARTEETVNYEISKTVKNHVRESGVIRRMSVAVLVDGTYTEGPKGEQVYKARSQEEMDKLEALVRNAIGYNAERGDKVELINMQFAAPEKGAIFEEPLFGLTKADYFRLGEMIVLGIVAVLVILLVVRPLLSRVLDTLPTALDAAKESAMLANQSEELAALTAPPGTGLSAPLESDEEGGGESMIDIDMVEGRVRASTIRKISEIVERHPEETVAILRQWMYQDS